MKKLKDILKESNVQIGKVYSNPYATAFVKENEEQEEPQIELSEEQKKAFLEAVKQYKKYGEAVYRNAGLGEVYESIKNMVEMAGKVTLSETDDWFDNVTVSRHMKRMGESFKVFEKTLKEVSTLQQRLEASYDEIGEVLGKYYEISEELDPVGKEDGDIDNDGDEDASDEYLANRRKVISKAIKNESMKLTDMIKKPSVNEADIPGIIPSQVKVKLEKAVSQIKDSNLSYPQRLKVLSHVLDSLDIDKKELTKMTTRLKGTLEGVNESTLQLDEGTRSQVGLIDKSGKILSAYVHYDGYPSNMKPGIKKHMKNEKDVLKLIKMGGASGIFDDKPIEYYNEKPNPTKGDVTDIKKYLKTSDSRGGADYVYLYDMGDKKWYMADVRASELKGLYESVNEAASRTAMEIGGLTGMNKDAIQKFVDTNELDIEKVFQFVKKGKLSDRMDLVSAIAGKPDNPIQKKMIKMFGESVNEGKKVFKVNPAIGKAKYSISSHDGVKKHKDGSDFFDIETFKNKVDLEKAIKNYTSKGFKMESVNEDASRTAMEIGALTGITKYAIQKFVDDNNLDIEKVFQFVKKGKLKDRLDFGTAVVGKPNNPIQKKMVKMFGESVNENKNVGHYERVGNQTIVDSNFVNFSKGVLPNSELVHLGMGDFALKTPKGDITFTRSGKLVGIGEDFVGRPHRMTDNKGGKLVDELIKSMVKKKTAILSMSESVNEGFSTEEKRIVLMAVKKIQKYMNVDLPTAMNYLLGAGKELERDIEKGKVK